ncbi:ATP-dependent DNA ligase [Methanosphaerula palustris]|uniref:DNA ligase n=1 Tax=Methanosphaerula palustris (strain ATCC BAA-1556 / DSM 19958 / E1-9c) TaxID=521011 RepID=DNLI_METPE|nr:ATP-dependent DNA ligase [Methanosphaerula palustris]B8GGB8.1 RecName: Full=DNA ligase; AltName: Full=Polydeoxyribonucleotide synthase [ATP] [Methanosphaerula palustris E1-9c]ACL18036.1 DNA ligase I, ATP-dependent Dnl1 [Methanosphaerula palustris E1-9c]
MQFSIFAQTCAALEAQNGRLEMKHAISVILPSLSGEDLPIFIRFLMGKIFPDWSPQKLGIGPNLLYEAVAYVAGTKKTALVDLINRTGDAGLAIEQFLATKEQTAFFTEDPSLAEVYAACTRIAASAGGRSQRERLLVLRQLFGNVSPFEARYLARLILGELRIGIGEGTVRDAIAEAYTVEPAQVEHAMQALNDLGEVALRAREGEEGLIHLSIAPFRPVKMMLAQAGTTIPEMLAAHGEVAVEFKYDGTRFQFHKEGKTCRIYSRKLEEVTDAVPEVGEALLGATDHDVILDGEVIAIGADGRPLPFQTVLRRFRRKHGIAAAREAITLVPRVFDILYRDGETLIDLPFQSRRAILSATIGPEYLAPQQVLSSAEAVDLLYLEAMAEGHEGVMLKDLLSLYSPGVRGKHWVKIKPEVETLDLVVIGAEWGEGRRARTFGSFLLACLDQGVFRAVSKVATGISDEQLQELYTLFKDQVIAESGNTVTFEPTVIFEVGYAEIQKSPSYESGYALRFPRFVQVRDDKAVEEIETLESLTTRYLAQKTQANGQPEFTL